MADIGHEIVFTGTLTFEAGELVVDGEFLNYSFPGGSDGLYPAPILTGRPSAAGNRPSRTICCSDRRRMTHDHSRLAYGDRPGRRASALAGCVLALVAMTRSVGAETAATARLHASFQVHAIVRGPHHIYAREYPGAEPTLVLMHGFPDDLQLYDRLVPLLSGRHVVVFDFLGWGRSDKPHGYPYTFYNLKGDLDAVLTQLR